MATKNYAYRSYSMEYGTFVGLGWGALFLTYVGGIAAENALLLLLCFLLCPVCFMMPFFFAIRLNRKMHGVGERLSYVQGLFFSLSMFMYACLMNGLIVFTYFQWMDDGSLYTQLNQMFTQTEIAATYEQIGMGEQYLQMIDMLKQVDELSPFNKTLAVFNNNFFFGLVMSFLTAVVASYDLRKIRKHQQQ